jgi:hypothetical protein
LMSSSVSSRKSTTSERLLRAAHIKRVWCFCNKRDVWAVVASGAHQESVVLLQQEGRVSGCCERRTSRECGASATRGTCERLLRAAHITFSRNMVLLYILYTLDCRRSLTCECWT